MSIEYFIPFATDTQNTIQNPSTPSSPPFITYQRKNQMASPEPQGEF